MRPLSGHRGFAWIGIALALLVHLALGVTGPDTRLCVCANGVMIERLEDDCCAQAETETPRPTSPTPCDADCHLIPLPDITTIEVPTTSAMLPVIDLPASSLLAHLVWPAPSRLRASRIWRQPPDPALRALRSVVLIC